MFNNLKILNLEDSEIDAELIYETLRETWPNCSMMRVDTEAEFIQAIENGGVDVILADYSLPGFDGMAALHVSRQRFPEIPFILVSGTLGEETAIDSLKSGATDYVLKHRLSRLVPAVQRALNERAERIARQEAENKLLLAARQWQISFDAMAYGVSILSANHTILNINREACRLLGKSVEDVIGKKCFQVFHGLEKTIAGCPMEKSRFSKQQEYVELYEPFLDKWLAVSTSPILDENGQLSSMVHTIHDISQRVNAEKEHILLESQLRHAQKMEAVGTLAGGIAHDFNNMLNVIMGYGMTVEKALEMSSPLREYMREVLGAAERAAQLVKRILLFSRKETLEVKAVNMVELIAGFKKMILRIIGEDIALSVNVHEKRLPIMADSLQIEQVLMNLITNARDAMPVGGSLSITAEIAEMNKAFIAAHGYGKLGKYARISVSDTGSGIDTDIMKKIFEPFFTTKAVGKGTGLGLAISYSIIKQHGGYLDVVSRPTEGATFLFYLPLIESSAMKAAEMSTPVILAGGNEVVLVAEDDKSLRELIRIVLESSGYRVILAVDGDDAIQCFKAHKDEIQLVVLDMIMPKKCGPDAYAVINKMAPGIKALFSSGYSGDMAGRFGAIEKANIIEKPFLPSVFLQKVRSVLDA